MSATKKEFDSKLKETLNAHWTYINGLLEVHGVKKSTLKKISYHYQTAFIHGYKHGFEDALEEVEK